MTNETKTYAITEDQLKKLWTKNTQENIDIVVSLPLITGEPCNEDLAADIECIDTGHCGSPFYEHDAYYMREAAAKRVRDGYPLYTHSKPLKPQSFDEWQRSPHMTRFQRFIDEAYVLKPQPITADDVTDEMVQHFHAQYKNGSVNSNEDEIVAGYNAVIKHKGDTK